MTTPQQVLKRFKVAGGTDFSVTVMRADPASAFNEAVSNARYESGHGGYTGTIAEKSGYTIRSRTPMSVSEARAFVNKDLDNNDKWGPAFAVPITRSTKSDGKTKEVVFKVECRTEFEVESLASKLIAEKFGGPGLSVESEIKKVTHLKAGKVPKMDVEMVGATYFALDSFASILNSLPSHNRYKTRSEAVEALKILGMRGKLTKGDSVTIKQVKELARYTVTDATKSLNTYEVRAVITVSKVTQSTKIDGWIFYGIASS